MKRPPMKPPSDKIVPRLAIAATALLLGTAGVLHFTDDPAPDLSRFSRPAHDPVAYAKVIDLCEEFETRHKAYAPQEPGDPDDVNEFSDVNSMDAAHMLGGLALRGDANAVRALRRHLKENEAALATAREVIALKAFAYDLVPKGTLSMPIMIVMTLKKSHRLVHRTALLAGIDGKTGPAWAMLGDCLAATRTRERTIALLTTGMDGLEYESIVCHAANTLASFETDPAKLRTFLVQMDRHAPNPFFFREVLEREMLTVVYALMPAPGEPSRTEFLGLEKPVNLPTATLKEKTQYLAEKAKREWLRWNFLPNATVAVYVRHMEEEIAATGPVATVTPMPNNEGMRILLRNAGGRKVLCLFDEPYQFVREKYFANRALHDLTRVALALRVYQLEHEGRRPATLAELAPGILPAVPADPFDGKALRYDDASGKVWSVGADLKDGGGDKENDLVVAPPERGPAAR